MALSVIPINEIAPDEWDSLVRASPDGWVFGLYGWQKLVTEVEPWGFEELGFGLHDGSKLVAVMPLHFQPSSKTAASSGWGGAGPIVLNETTAVQRATTVSAALAEATRLALAAGAERLAISTSPVTRSAILGGGAGLVGFDRFKQSSQMSQVVELEGEDAVWAGLSKVARNLVRKAEKLGYSVEQVDWLASLDTYYDVHVETYTRTGVAPHPKSYFEGIAKHVASTGASRLLAVLTPQREPIAFHNMAVLGEGACYHTGCSRDQAQRSGAGYLLMWEALRAARSAGVRWYDCGWIFPDVSEGKQYGLTLFKTRFGGQPRLSFRAELTFAGANAPQNNRTENPERTLTGRLQHLLSRLR